MNKKITPEIASRALGCSAQAVRIALQRGIIPIGEAIKMNGKSYTYLIPAQKLANYIGCSVEDLEKYR